MVNLYKQQLGTECPDVNSARLEDKLLAELPNLDTYNNGRGFPLAVLKDVGSVATSFWVF